MEKLSLNRNSELHLNRQVTLKNRVVLPPMASGTADVDGFVTERTIDHYQRLSQSGAALQIVEYTYVHSSGRSEEHQLGIQTDLHIDGLRRIVSVIKTSGAIAGIQLTHGGGKSDRTLTGGPLMSASAIAVPVKGEEMEVPEAMSRAEIDLWKQAFADAAERAVAAGFDLIELHSAHGYGLNQWLSPITNGRNDEYGGDQNARMKLLLEIIGALRTKHPQVLISVRMPGQDFLPGGLQIANTKEIAITLEAAGVDILNISSGIGGWRRPGERNGEGYLVSEAKQIQAVVKIPVIGVGGIKSGEYIDKALQNSYFSLAAVGRAILQDAKAWREQVLS